MFFNYILSLFSNDIAIDLGTANTLVYVKGKGIVLREPSIVSIQKGTRNLLAVGNDAKEMVGRTPGNIIAVRPLKDGVISDFAITEEMLRYFILKVHKRKSFVSPRVIISVPSGITEVEKRAVHDSAERAGASDIYLIEEPMAAAIGAGLPVKEATGSMIVDIGGGTTEVAVISLSGIVVSKSIRIAGDEMDEAIIEYLKKTYNLLIGERTAESIKINIGSAYPLKEKETMEVKGRDLVSGLPRILQISDEEIREALSEPVSHIVMAVKETLEITPPELSSDILEKGMCITGGGSLLRGLDELLHQETELSVFIAENPLLTVVLGTGQCLDNLDLLKKISVQPKPYG